MLHQRGNPLAFVGATRFYLCPDIERLHHHNRDRRAIEAVCVALLQRKNPGPFFLAGPPRH